MRVTTAVMRPKSKDIPPLVDAVVVEVIVVNKGAAVEVTVCVTEAVFI